MYNNATRSGNHVCVWDTTTLKLLHIMEKHNFPIIAVLGHPRLPHLAVTCGRDGRVVFWDVAVGKCLQEFAIQHENSQVVDALDAAFDPSGNHLAVCDLWGQLTVFGAGRADQYRAAPHFQYFNIDVAPFLR